LGVSGRPGLGLGALSEDNNSAGARLVAAQYPQGYSYGQFLSGDGGVKAAIVIGANPAGDLLATGGKPTSLTGLELLVVSELFLSETAQLAHVVLPTSSFAEIDGTFTNLEGRVQLVKQAIPPLQGTAPNLAIILELASRLGKALPVQSVSGIFEELANENAAFAGLSYEEIGPLGALTGANRKVPAGT
jgi:predicted molibdopterin-dependent oxidoreductase YjgC